MCILCVFTDPIDFLDKLSIPLLEYSLHSILACDDIIALVLHPHGRILASFSGCPNILRLVVTLIFLRGMIVQDSVEVRLFLLGSGDTVTPESVINILLLPIQLLSDL